MIPSSPRYALSVVNAVGTGSLYIALTNDNSATASPNNAPAAVTGKQLTGGVDPADPAVTDREAAVTSPCPMDYVPNVLNFAMPGETTTAVVSSAITYASTRPYTFFVMDCPQGQSPAQVVTYAQSIGYGTSSSISQASLYYPWVVASNPGNNNAISTITMPPSGFVLGQIATMDTNIGPWYPPAGTNTSLVGAVGTERTLSPTDLATLNLANVDAIRQRPDGNTIIWGARTMLTGYATQYINVRRMLNYVEASLASLLTGFVFAPNDQVLWAQIVATCTQFLSGLAHRNAFAGSTAADQFYVTCDDTNNTPTSIQSGVVNVTVGLALLYPAEFIALNISQFQNSGTSTVSSTTP
jgi:phage tail sheath protein FI